MKRILCFLAAIILCVSLVSCGGGANDAKKAYTFKKGNVEIAIGDEVAPVLEALGKWNDYVESPSCGFTGVSKLYSYTSLDIETYPLDGKDYVYMIQIKDDSVSTQEGIRIGDKKDAVTAAYGTPAQESDSMLIYRADGMYLRILLKNNSVSKIQYLHSNAIENN